VAEDNDFEGEEDEDEDDEDDEDNMDISDLLPGYAGDDLQSTGKKSRVMQELGESEDEDDGSEVLAPFLPLLRLFLRFCSSAL